MFNELAESGSPMCECCGSDMNPPSDAYPEGSCTYGKCPCPNGKLPKYRPRYVDRHGDTLGYVSPELRDQDGVTVDCPLCGELIYGTDLIRTANGYVCDDCSEDDPFDADPFEKEED